MNNNDKKSSGEAQGAKTPVWEIFIWLFWIFGSFVVIGSCVFMWYYFSHTTNGLGYCRKDVLKNELKTKISNGADLVVVEDVFADRYKHSTDTREWNFRLEKDYYGDNATLLKVLRDLRSDYFDSVPYTVPPTIRDTAYYYRLSMIIDEYMRKTPFDGLEKGQQELFVNIQMSLGDNYDGVEEKITRIVDELRSKNALVDKYLNNSENSYKLSLVALVTTIFFGIFGVLGLVESIRARKERQASKK